MGIQTGTFHPDDFVTRAEVAQIIARMKQFPESQTGTSGLSDIEGNWAESAIVAYTQNALISGYPDGTFRPDQSIKRAETVTLIHRMLGRKAGHSAGLQFKWIDVPVQYWAYNDILDASVVREYEHGAGAKIYIISNGNHTTTVM